MIGQSAQQIAVTKGHNDPLGRAALHVINAFGQPNAIYEGTNKDGSTKWHWTARNKNLSNIGETKVTVPPK